MRSTTTPRIRQGCTPKANGMNPVVKAPVATSDSNDDLLGFSRQKSANEGFAAAESEFHVIINHQETPKTQDLEKQLEEVFERSAESVDKYALVSSFLRRATKLFGGRFFEFGVFVGTDRCAAIRACICDWGLDIEHRSCMTFNSLRIQ
uniref:Uncharacterized protein n=1 Tax=Bigelowiella natans TaxID=227086 RepID=A0A7S2P4K8_BIGNA|mmetsp:Transcript_108/g.146  ORF Transcript_108/g.146 Transcript_108/m.146 type:complete len:149 (+) Transcript_108:124-570(+)